MRGFFEIGIYHPKTAHNIGTLWRSAYQMGAAGIFTIHNRYKHQASDVLKTPRHIPYRHYDCFEEFYRSLPYDTQLIGIEMGGSLLSGFSHPERGRLHTGSRRPRASETDHGSLPQNHIN